jgi:hypothetical protein
MGLAYILFISDSTYILTAAYGISFGGLSLRTNQIVPELAFLITGISSLAT